MPLYSLCKGHSHSLTSHSLSRQNLEAPMYRLIEGQYAKLDERTRYGKVLAQFNTPLTQTQIRETRLFLHLHRSAAKVTQPSIHFRPTDPLFATEKMISVLDYDHFMKRKAQETVGYILLSDNARQTLDRTPNHQVYWSMLDLQSLSHDKTYDLELFAEHLLQGSPFLLPDETHLFPYLIF